MLDYQDEVLEALNKLRKFGVQTRDAGILEAVDRAEALILREVLDLVRVDRRARLNSLLSNACLRQQHTIPTMEPKSDVH